MPFQLKRGRRAPTQDDLVELYEGQPLVDLSNGDMYIGHCSKKVGQALVEAEREQAEAAEAALSQRIDATTKIDNTTLIRNANGEITINPDVFIDGGVATQVKLDVASTGFTTFNYIIDCKTDKFMFSYKWDDENEITDVGRPGRSIQIKKSISTAYAGQTLTCVIYGVSELSIYADSGAGSNATTFLSLGKNVKWFGPPANNTTYMSTTKYSSFTPYASKIEELPTFTFNRNIDFTTSTTLPLPPTLKTLKTQCLLSSNSSVPSTVLFESYPECLEHYIFGSSYSGDPSFVFDIDVVNKTKTKSVHMPCPTIYKLRAGASGTPDRGPLIIHGNYGFWGLEPRIQGSLNTGTNVSSLPGLLKGGYQIRKDGENGIKPVVGYEQGRIGSGLVTLHLNPEYLYYKAIELFERTGVSHYTQYDTGYIPKLVTDDTGTYVSILTYHSESGVWDKGTLASVPFPFEIQSLLVGLDGSGLTYFDYDVYNYGTGTAKMKQMLSLKDASKHACYELEGFQTATLSKSALRFDADSFRDGWNAQENGEVGANISSVHGFGVCGNQYQEIRVYPEMTFKFQSAYPDSSVNSFLSFVEEWYM